MLKIGIHSHPYNPLNLEYMRSLLQKLGQQDVEIIISDILANFLAQSQSIDLRGYSIFTRETLPKDTNVMFSLGGDGTLLETMLYIKDKEIPILGINTGRVGFLTAIDLAQVDEALKLFWNGFYTIDKRTPLQISGNKNLFQGYSFALNDVTLLRNQVSSMIVIHIHLDGQYLNSYWGDGILVSTATGSTAYSLSVGGPIVMPYIESFIIAPICPHNLNVRPVVVSENSVIDLKVEGREKYYAISLDSRIEKFENDVNIRVQKCDFKVKLIRFQSNDFFDVLRNKLSWGLDMRNA